MGSAPDASENREADVSENPEADVSENTEADADVKPIVQGPATVLILNSNLMELRRLQRMVTLLQEEISAIIGTQEQK